jgi:hypothetical protein
MTNEGYSKLEKRKSIGVVNIADVALQHIKDVGFIKTTDANGNVMNITTNGPKSVEAYNAVYRSIVTRPEYAEQNRVLSIARGEMEMDKIKKDNPNVPEQQLKDAFAETGFGFGWTFKEPFYGFRIDYVLYDPDSFTPVNYQLDKVNYSDHYPVSCQFKINKI